ncbi:DUF2304 family protein [Candidatus Gottesmanbacteria bacterium]|nr:DUF2304 family protein [Candidatus Gottesmanbacteria bacterium]
MSVTLTQFVLSIFLFFALSRTFLRLRSGELSLIGFFFWSAIFSLAIIIVLFPELTSFVASPLGIGRGADVVVYVSIALLFYLVFRLYIFLEDIRHEITKLVQQIALQNDTKKSKK